VRSLPSFLHVHIDSITLVAETLSRTLYSTDLAEIVGLSNPFSPFLVDDKIFIFYPSAPLRDSDDTDALENPAVIKLRTMDPTTLEIGPEFLLPQIS